MLIYLILFWAISGAVTLKPRFLRSLCKSLNAFPALNRFTFGRYTRTEAIPIAFYCCLATLFLWLVLSQESTIAIIIAYLIDFNELLHFFCTRRTQNLYLILRDSA